MSPIVSPPSPEVDQANLSNYYPYTNENEDEGFEENEDEDNDDDLELNQEHLIQVITGIHQPSGWWDNQTLPQGRWQQTTNNTTIRRDNRVLLAAQLLTIFVTNHRSFFPEFHNFIDAIKTLDLTVGLHSEIWESQENKSHQNKIEAAFQLEGINYISNPRPDRRGGGAAITLVEGSFQLTKLDIIIPKNLEVVWGLVRPKEPTIHFKGIIVCSFYCAPNSRKKSQLIQHITINHSSLKVRYKDTFFMIGGDRNDLDIKRLLDISPTLHSLNTKPTHGKKNIDVIVTDMVHLFEESVIIPNVPTDIPDGQPGGGKRSDHPIVYSRPRTSMLKHPDKEVIIKKTRRLDDEKSRKVRQWIQQETWEEVFNANSDSGMAEKLPEVVFRKLDEICPVEEIKLTKFSEKVIAKALQELARQKLREYNKHGNSQRAEKETKGENEGRGHQTIGQTT